MIKDHKLIRPYTVFTLVSTLLNSLFNMRKDTGKLVVEETPEIDKKKYDKKKIATFSMGCFWGPDSIFGAVPGVIRTKVGYAGGSRKDPTYHKLGDHTETVQMTYDPEEVSYEELIDLFWYDHDPTFSKSTQYKSIIFFHDEEQEKRAYETKERREERSSRSVKTEIRQFSNFHKAEDYHQKYHLSQHKRLYKAYRGIYPSMEDFTASTAVARVNGYVSGHGTIESDEYLQEMGLTKEGIEMLLERWRSSGGERSCGPI